MKYPKETRVKHQTTSSDLSGIALYVSPPHGKAMHSSIQPPKTPPAIRLNGKQIKGRKQCRSGSCKSDVWNGELGRDGRMGIGAVGLLALGWAAEVWWTILWILKKCLLTL